MKKFKVKGKKYTYSKELNGGKSFESLSDNDNVGLYDKDDEQVYIKKKELNENTSAFNELYNSIKIMFEEKTDKDDKVKNSDAEEIQEVDEVEDEASIRQGKILEKFETLGDEASAMLQKTIIDKNDIFMNKIRSVGINDVLYDFVVNKFIPSLEDSDIKLFLTVNLDEFVGYFIEKFSSTLI